MPMSTDTDSAVTTAALTSPLWVQALHGMTLHISRRGMTR